MSDNPPDDPLFAIREDLKAYDNPEVFEDSSLPQVYLLRITNLHLANLPTVIDIAIDGEILSQALLEDTFGIMRHSEKEMLIAYEVDHWSKVRDQIIADEDFQKTALAMRWFFIKNFPRLMVDLYNLTSIMSVMSAFGELFDQDAEKQQREQLLRLTLKASLRALEKDIKLMLGTRRRGGSRGKLETAERRSFNAWYAQVHQLTKPIKKHYDQLFKEFAESRRRKGYTHEEWQQFWQSHAQQLYGYDNNYLSLFSDPDNLSASEITYAWIAKNSGYTIKYTKRLVMESRKKVTMKRSK